MPLYHVSEDKLEVGELIRKVDLVYVVSAVSAVKEEFNYLYPPSRTKWKHLLQRAAPNDEAVVLVMTD